LSPRWAISAGELFELTRPAAFVLSALISTWVFSSARRRGFSIYGVLAWALTTLFYPLIILPIYLIVRAARRRRATPAAQEEPAEDNDEASIDSTGESISDSAQPAPKVRLRFLLPLLYLLAVLSLGALFYYLDSRTIDAHLARANRARLLGKRDRTIKEYRAALELEENAHTRNLLGIELAADNQLEEALAEFRAAERGGEPDDELFYRIATTLDALKRTSEAVPEYEKFLGTRRCNDDYPDPKCAASRERVKSKL
jgi:tetratricopeptide (TPR) repeat protein